jgi:DNA gyrase subunit A
VRRNSLADFENINRHGKIAMKLDEGDSIVRVAICRPGLPLGEDAEADHDEPSETIDEDGGVGSEASDTTRKVQVLDNVFLTTAAGRCNRFAVDDVRFVKTRASTGVRGIRLAKGDELISMAIIQHVDASPGERAAYIKQALSVRRAQSGETAEGAGEVEAEEDAEEAVELSPERYAELGAHEQFILTVSERGFGKRTSSYAYRITGRGGKGMVAMAVNDRNGRLVASFPVEDDDQIMLVTDGGQLIRCPVDDVRIAGRNAQGVRILKTDESEKVVSVERIPEDGNGNAEPDSGEGDTGEPAGN